MVRPSLISKNIFKNHVNIIKKINNNSYYFKTNIIMIMLITIFIMYLYIRYIDKHKKSNLMNSNINIF